MGLLARNMSTWTSETYNPTWGMYFEVFTSMVIVTRGALELEFKGAYISITLLAFVPFIIEALCDFTLLYLAVEQPAMVSLSFGLSMTAVAPAVITPQMISLVK